MPIVPSYRTIGGKQKISFPLRPSSHDPMMKSRSIIPARRRATTPLIAFLGLASASGCAAFSGFSSPIVTIPSSKSKSSPTQEEKAPSLIPHPPETPPPPEILGADITDIAADDDDSNSIVAPSSADVPGAASAADDFTSILMSRRTINEFDPTLPDGWQTAMEKAITAATYAPNHKRTEPWRFHLLGPKSIEEVCQLNAKLVSEKKGPEAGEKKLKRWLKMPGWLVVTCVRDGTSPSMDEDPSGLARENYAAVCCAVQNLCLSLHASGIGTKWTTGPVNFHSSFADAAGIPEEEYVVGTIWFGSSEAMPEPPKKKLSFSDVLTWHE